MSKGIVAVMLFIFLLAAFAIGASLAEQDDMVIQLALDNVSNIMSNYTINVTTDNHYLSGFFKVLEKGTQFFGVLATELMRSGIKFGQQHPEYFNPDYTLEIIKLIVYCVIFTVAIRPAMYILAFLFAMFIWVKDKIRNL